MMRDHAAKAKDCMYFSAVHEPDRWPGVMLPGTSKGIMCLDLPGGLADEVVSERAARVERLKTNHLHDGRS
jgi:hypothetical protein